MQLVLYKNIASINKFILTSAVYRYIGVVEEKFSKAAYREVGFAEFPSLVSLKTITAQA
jgi:hypothetical protein